MQDSSSLDNLARYNKERWDALAEADVAYSRPLLDLSAESARQLLDPHSIIGDLTDRNVLCLASGGGQQSVAFALLGANVTVLDLSDAQLERDRTAAEHYGLTVTTKQGDMRNLSCFESDPFDIVYQAYSINFVPDVTTVHAAVSRVLKPGGLYRLEWSNPFTQTIDNETWTGEGYLLNQPYIDGRNITELFPTWDVTARDGSVRKVDGPHEFVHTLSAMINSLIQSGFVIVHASEDTGAVNDRSVAIEPGSWAHFMQIAAPYLTLWSRYLPHTLEPAISPIIP